MEFQYEIGQKNYFLKWKEPQNLGAFLLTQRNASVTLQRVAFAA
jgi:hypothetical protein